MLPGRPEPALLVQEIIGPSPERRQTLDLEPQKRCAGWCWCLHWCPLHPLGLTATSCRKELKKTQGHFLGWWKCSKSSCMLHEYRHFQNWLSYILNNLCIMLLYVIPQSKKILRKNKQSPFRHGLESRQKILKACRIFKYNE